MIRRILQTVLMVVLTGIAVTAYSQVPPSLLSPQNVATCITLNPKLEWTAMENAQSYHVQVADTNDFSSYIIDTAGVVTSTLNVNLPKNSTIYYWRVTVTYPGGGHGTSATFQFTTRRPSPNTTVPADESMCMDKVVKLKWNLDGATYYRVQISDQANFANVIIDRNNIAADSFQTVVPNYDTKYYWHVSSTKDGCESDWSTAKAFTTKTAPPAAIFPADSAKGADILSEMPFIVKLKWKSIPTADTYDIQLGTKANFDTLYVDESHLIDTTYTVVLGQSTDSLYFWRIRSVKNGCEGDWSRTFVFNTPYMAPLTIEPLSNATCVYQTHAQFRWQTVPKALGYRIQVSDTITFSRIKAEQAVNDSNNFVLSLEKPFTKYYWRVRAEDKRNSGLWSAIDSFETSQRAPDLYYPRNDTAGIPANYTLVWERLPDTSVYRIQLSESPDFADGTILVDSTDIDTNKLAITLLKNNFLYYWRAKAILDDCESNWSEPFVFRTLIDHPVLIDPAHNSVEQSIYPIFRWHSVPTATGYDIQLTMDSTFKNVPQYRFNLNDTIMSFAGEALQEDARYFWRVRSVNSDGRSVWSPFFAFNTGILPADQPQLISPPNGSTKIDINNVKLVWHKVSNSTKYIVQLAYSEDFNEVFKQFETTDTTQVITGLTNYTYYYWRVRSANVDGEGTWSVVWYFRTIALPVTDKPELKAPVNNLELEANYTTLKWLSTQYALGYRLIVSTSADFMKDTVYYAEQMYDTQKVVYNLPYNVTYYWKVKAWNEVNEGDWSDTWNFTTKIPAAIQDEELTKSFTIQPQPANTHMQLQFNVVGLKKTTVAIFDLQGSKIAEFDLGMVEGNQAFDINTGGIANGIYAVRLMTDNSVAVKMIRIAR